MARRGICCDSLPGIQAEDCDIILVVKHYQPLPTKLHLLDRSSRLEAKDHAYTPLPVDVDLARAELRIVGANSEEGLNWFVGQGRYLRVDTIASKLYH